MSSIATYLVFHILTFNAHHSMMPDFIVISNDGTTRKVITNYSTPVDTDGRFSSEWRNIHNYKLVFNVRNRYLTSSKCSYPLSLYLQRHGSLGITDNHSLTLQKVQQYKKDQWKHPTLDNTLLIYNIVVKR